MTQGPATTAAISAPSATRLLGWALAVCAIILACVAALFAASSGDNTYALWRSAIILEGPAFTVSLD